MKNTVIVKVMGGFGNQLFCYACGYVVAKETGKDIVIDTSQQDNDVLRHVDVVSLNVQYRNRITFKKGSNFLDKAIWNRLKLLMCIGVGTKVIKEKRYYCYQPDIFTNRKENLYLDGYWQSYKYFEKYRKDIVKMYVPKEKITKLELNYMNSLEEKTSIAIHIRRGDYIQIGCNIDKKYYEDAIAYMRKALGSNIRFYLFSDDIQFAQQFAKQHEDLDMVVVKNINSKNQTIEDFFLMSNCNHFIIANSSYSWWAAWLNSRLDKIVICPEVESWKEDFYPSEWIKLSADIKKD